LWSGSGDRYLYELAYWRYSPVKTRVAAEQPDDGRKLAGNCRTWWTTLLQSAQAFLQKEFGLALEMSSTIRCEFNSFNKECLRFECPFFAMS
jgi:hypothetical protein